MQSSTVARLFSRFSIGSLRDLLEVLHRETPLTTEICRQFITRIKGKWRPEPGSHNPYLSSTKPCLTVLIDVRPAAESRDECLTKCSVSVLGKSRRIVE